MADPEDPFKAAVAGRYTIERELGRGGMATVYLAMDVKHRRQVALKVLDPELARAIGPRRFLQEIEIAARLTHPNILPLHDSGEADGLLYYVMPYVEGESLRDRLRRERHLGLDDAVKIIGAVGAALGHAHRHGVIHRDIKPENILLPGGHAVVADFGIARAIDAAGTDQLTGTGLAVGTPAYMSPEQAGAERALDGRADIYSLGCVAYEMLAGEPPFTGPSPQAVMARHSVDPVPPLRTLRPTAPLGVARAIERALAKVPADRFATAEDFAEAMSRASTAEAIAADLRRSRHAGRRWVAGMVAGAALLAASAWWLATPGGAPSIRRFAVLPFASPVNEPGQEYFTEGLHDALISELARAGLGVIARTSVMQYRNTERPVRVITRELGVDALVEPLLTRTEDSVMIQVRLVDGSTEQYVWTESYSSDLGHLPTLTREVARGIAIAIQPARRGQSETPLAGARPVNPDVYDAYLKGQFYLRAQGRAEIETALGYFQLALEKDSTYAPAYAGISNVWGVRRQRGYVLPQDATPRANAAALKALELDSTLAEPHFALATTTTWGEWDWHGGERAFRQAIRLKPDYPQARAFYSHLLGILGHPEEAMEQIERARDLDPLDPLLQMLYGGVLTIVHRYDDAIAQYRESLQQSPSNTAAQWLLWLTLHHKGDHAAALVEARNWAEAESDQQIAAALDVGYRQAGYAGAMRAVAETLVARSRTGYVGPWNIAIWYAAAGDNDRALDWLERAFEVRDPGMPYLAVHPSWVRLRADPRFQTLVRRMNLPS